MKGKWRF